MITLVLTIVTLVMTLMVTMTMTMPVLGDISDDNYFFVIHPDDDVDLHLGHWEERLVAHHQCQVVQDPLPSHQCHPEVPCRKRSSFFSS